MSESSDPGPVWEVINGYSSYWVVVAAVRLGLFDALAAGPLPAPGLAGACRAGPTRTAVLADALVAVGLLDADHGTYRLTPTADELLVSGRPRSMRDLVMWSPGPHANWPVLEHTVSGARPAAPVEDDPIAFYARLGRATRPTQLRVARDIVAQLALRRGARMLELGAGGAPWSTALLEGDDTAFAVVNDLPGVLDEAVTALGGFAARCAFVAGDYLAVALEAGTFDLVVLSHVLRAEPDSRAEALVARAAAALASGGRLVIAEYLGGRDPRAYPQAAFLAVTMMAATAEGRLCTAELLERWLADAGCTCIERFEPVANTDVTVAGPPALS